MKYIIFESVNGVAYFPVLFPEVVQHSVVGNAFGGADNIVSAGYVRVYTDGSGVFCKCSKGSITYPNKPVRRDEDEAIIESSIKFQG